MPAPARFPTFSPARGGYESYYVRAVDPRSPRAVWLRHTIHQRRSHPPDPVGSCWVTLFGVGGGGPVAHKVSVPGPVALPEGGVRIGESAFGPGGVDGRASTDAEWSLTWSGADASLRHLPAGWMYRAPLPRTKLESPRPAVRVSGRVRVGAEELELDGWPGMVGHNWGAQHAERWIWLHGVAFDDTPDAWLDLALGQIKVAGRTTPWVANGALSIGGERVRLGGLRAKPEVHAGARHLELSLPGALRLTVRSPLEDTIVWRYADPDGSEHHVAHCSVAPLEVVLLGGTGPTHAAGRTLRTAHGAAYEYGARERPAELAVQPFGDP